MTPHARARHHYELDDVAHAYGERSALLPAETALLARYREQFLGSRLLDLGCGGGRTSRWLAELAGDYVGLDYAARMIEVCRARYPDLRFVQGDATDLAAFADASMDAVFFSYNGIDSMSQAMRLRTLDAIARILVPDGIFAFSAHNRDYGHLVRHIDARAGIHPAALRRQARNALGFLAVRHLEETTDEYAIWSDPRLGFRQMSYFISPPHQIEQLRARGFTGTTVFAWDGGVADPATPDRVSMSHYYVCRNGTGRGEDR